MKKISWLDVKKNISQGDIMDVLILKHEPYGVIVDFGYEYSGIIQITDFKDDGIMTSAEYPPIGTKIKAKVLGFKDHGFQIWFGVRPSQLK